EGVVFLVIDGWPAIGDYPGNSESDNASGDLESAITQIAQRGPAHGVHVIITADRWSRIRPSVRQALDTMLELRLSDPYESEVSRHAAAALPATPGHGLTAHGTHFLAALPSDDRAA